MLLLFSLLTSPVVAVVLRLWGSFLGLQPPSAHKKLPLPCQPGGHSPGEPPTHARSPALLRKKGKGTGAEFWKVYFCKNPPAFMKGYRQLAKVKPTHATHGVRLHGPAGAVAFLSNIILLNINLQNLNTVHTPFKYFP